MSHDHRVLFDAVEIREYPIVLGNNPSSTIGPSIEIGWEYTDLEPQDVEDHANRKTIKRDVRALYVAPVVRESILLRSEQYSHQDIDEAVREKNKVRQQRERSNFITNSNPINDVRKKVRYQKRRKKIGCAIKNLQKEQQEVEVRELNLYRGWWLPFSAYVF
mmetsp:Transcript_8701/g.12307  ORF Transcript_8701/g.12307 Transcript_8701/m.12307 type:complete len:162 (-) Transcript_8701:176-661(-)